MCWKESQAGAEKFHHCGAAPPCIPEATLGLNGVAVLNLVTTLSQAAGACDQSPKFHASREQWEKNRASRTTWHVLQFMFAC